MTTETPNPTQPFDQWRDALKSLSGAMMQAAKSKPPEMKPAKYDQMAVLSSMFEVAESVAKQPMALLEMQAQAAKQWTDLWSSAWFPQADAEPVITPARGDRRFGDAKWEENPALKSLKQSYLLAGRQMQEVIGLADDVDPKAKAMTNFLAEQFMNAVAPTNFALTNPEVLRRTVETGGANLVSGFSNLLTDLTEGRGIIRRRTSRDFTLGETVAATPGGVVFQNELMQVIQYDPATKDVAKRPMLYIPPLVNKYYMIDLQPKSSMVRWLVEQGHTVFVVSWVNPTEAHRNAGVDTYIETGVLKAIDVVTQITGEKIIDLFGFCMGGTLIAITLAYLEAKGQADRVGSATLIASLVDFADMREWSAFAHEDHVDVLDDHIGKQGYIAGDELQQLFSLVRSNDLIWSAFVNHYLLNREAPASDILFWFEDGSAIPQAFLKSYNRLFMVDNALATPGGATILGEALDLSEVRTPIMAIALKDDHVSAWEAVYDGMMHFGGPKRFVLGGSGHNAGVINPPAANKHGYWTNDALPDTADAWFAAADKQPGSWWTTWSEWRLKNGSTDTVPARKVGSGKYKKLEAAPGSFVTHPN